jgi:hypothetical protein
MSLVILENEQFRRDVLMLLQADADYAMSNLLLIRALAALANPISHDRLTQQLHWLQDQGLVTLQTAENNIVLAKLTALGEDVALCRTTVPAIARPALS